MGSSTGYRCAASGNCARRSQRTAQSCAGGMLQPHRDTRNEALLEHISGVQMGLQPASSAGGRVCPGSSGVFISCIHTGRCALMQAAQACLANETRMDRSVEANLIPQPCGCGLQAFAATGRVALWRRILDKAAGTPLGIVTLASAALGAVEALLSLLRCVSKASAPASGSTGRASHSACQ